jgi:uncharacterized protein YhdP
MRRLLKFVLVVGLLLACGVGALLWRLNRGPISLTPLQPVIETLIARGSPYVITFSQPSLVWLRDEHVVALEVHDAEARTQAGAFVASAPLLRGTVAVRPLLLEQRIELVEVQLGLPQVELTRGDDGKLMLSFAGQLADLSLGEATGGGGFAAMLDDGSGSADPRLSAMRRMRITAPALEFVDTRSGDRATAADAVFDLERVDAGWRASLAARLGEGEVEATSEAGTTPSQQQVTVELKNLRAEDFQAFAPNLPLTGGALPVSGTVRFSVDPTTAGVGPATVDLTAGAGTIEAPSLKLAPVALKSVELRGQVDPAARQAQIDQLRVAAEGFGFAISGRIAETAGELTADLKLAAEDLDVGEILRLWPGAVAGEARSWIEANVPAGQIGAAALQLGQHLTRPDQPDLGGSFTFSGVQVRYLDTFPPATGLTGSASLAGNSLGFKVGAGRTGEVDLTRGDATLSNLVGAATTQLKVNADLRSTVPAAMRLLDAEPIGLRKATGLSAESASGQQRTKLELGLPLLDKIPPDRIRYKASTQLSDVELRDVQPGYSLAATSLPLVADTAGVGAKGEVRVNGVPVQVDWRENANPVRGVKRTLKASGSLDAAGARALAVTWPDAIGGSVGFDASMVEARSPLRTIDVALDLRRASIHIPSLVFTKQAGEPGTMSAKLVQVDQTRVRADDCRVEVAGWSAEGEAFLRLDPQRAERIVLKRLRTPLGDVTANLYLDGSTWRGNVDVGRLDVRPFMHESGDGGDGMAMPDFNLLVSAQQLRLGDAPLSRLTGSVERRGGIWQAANLRANIEDSDVNLDLNTINRQSAFSLRGSDAGWLIRGFAASDNGIRGGRFRLSADLRQAPTGLSGDGELKIRNFTLWGAPLIARIVSLASFTGLGNALGGQGVPVDRLVAPFRLQGDRITLEQARLVGSNVGARAEGTIDLAADRLDIRGTVAPAYTVNRILGRIPIVGQILSGSGSDAALAATFSVSGPLGEPQVSVNPLSVLVPGMIRDLFSAMTADTTSDGGGIDER